MKNYKQLLMVLLVLQSVFLQTAYAEIYKCTSKTGKVYYNDKPCPVKDKQKKMKAEKDVVNGYVPKTGTENTKTLTRRNMKTVTTIETSNEKSEQEENGLNTGNEKIVASKQIDNKSNSLNQSVSNKLNNNLLDSSLSQKSGTGESTLKSNPPQSEPEEERFLIDMLAGQIAENDRK